jgi:uncharacterized membrane protein (UPF0127 family)
MTRMRILCIGLLALAGGLAGCGKKDANAGDWVEINGQRWTVEIADTRNERALGLSGRESMADDAGMLFVYGAPEPMSFWMKGCLIDLDIAFIDSTGKIIDIQTMEAPAEGQRPASYSSSGPAQFVLETAAGAFQRRGIAEGDTVTFSPSIQDAIRRLEARVTD